MLDFTKEQMREYVEKKLAAGEPIICAKKTGNTIAVQGAPGQEVITWEVDKKTGESYIERPKPGEPIPTVQIDPITGEPGWILTKTGSDNQPVIDKANHTHEYIVPDSKFKEMYEPSPDGPGLYIKSQIEKFIRADEDVSFITKYGSTFIPAGGYIKITNLDSISGVNEQSFDETYIVVDSQEKKLQ